MLAWALAAGIMLAVLCFEFLVFRYVGSERASAAGRGSNPETPGGADPATDADPADGRSSDRRSRSTGDATGSAGASGHAPEGGVRCGECDAVNADVATVVFCRNCLSRLR